MKYIIFKDKKSGLFQPVIFGEHTTHAQISIDGAEPINAGFCHLSTEGGLSVYGESDSLGLKSEEKDGAYLAMLLCNAGTSYFLDYDKIETPGK